MRKQSGPLKFTCPSSLPETCRNREISLQAGCTQGGHATGSPPTAAINNIMVSGEAILSAENGG